MQCNIVAINNQMLKGGDMWDEQYRGLNGAVVKNSKATSLASGPGLTKVVIPKGAGLSEDRVNLRLLPALCKTENINSLVHDVVIYESSFVRQ